MRIASDNGVARRGGVPSRPPISGEDYEEACAASRTALVRLRCFFPKLGPEVEAVEAHSGNYPIDIEHHVMYDRRKAIHALEIAVRKHMGVRYDTPPLPLPVGGK